MFENELQLSRLQPSVDSQSRRSRLEPIEGEWRAYKIQLLSSSAHFSALRMGTFEEQKRELKRIAFEFCMNATLPRWLPDSSLNLNEGYSPSSRPIHPVRLSVALVIPT